MFSILKNPFPKILTAIFPILMACGPEDGKTATGDTYMVSKKLEKKALKESWDILKQGQEMVNSGKGFKDVLAMLPENSEVMLNHNSLIYFLEGSVPMLIEMPTDANQPITKGSSNMVVTQDTDAEMEQNIIGHRRGEPARERKTALIISPFLNEFGQNDDGLVAYNHLIKNKNYRGGITFLKNANSSENIVYFTDLGKYDLVHLSTHGKKFCLAPLKTNKDEGGDLVFEVNGSPGETFDLEEIFEREDAKDIYEAHETPENGSSVLDHYRRSKCNTLVATGVRHPFEYDDLDGFLEFLEDNKYYMPSMVFGFKNIYLKADYFLRFNNLKDKLWVFSACELGEDDDLLKVMQIQHENGNFLYWNNPISPDQASRAFDKFYENLVNEGLGVEKSFNDIPTDLRSGLHNEIGVKFKEGESVHTYATDLKLMASEKPLHGIEIAEFRNPQTDLLLNDGDVYPIAGQFGDGKNERLNIKLQLKGYDRDEFKPMTVSILADGKESSILDQGFIKEAVMDPNINLENIPGVDHGVEVIFDEVLIPDLKPDQEFLELKAYLHFEKDRKSVHTVRVNVNPKDVEVTGHSYKGPFTITHDYDAAATKFVVGGPSNTIFMDAKGYIYAFDDEDFVWRKINMTSMMDGTVQKMIQGMFAEISKNLNGQSLPEAIKRELAKPQRIDPRDNTAVLAQQQRPKINRFLDEMSSSIQQLDSEDSFLNPKSDKASLMRPIVNWSNQMTIANFKESQDFVEEEIRCPDQKGRCLRYRGVRNEAAGCVVTFNSENKVHKLVYKGQALNFRYGEFTVTLPAAVESPIFPNF